MTKIFGLSAILAFCATQVAAHSWINNPPQRFGPDHLDANQCLKNDDGTLFVDGNGHNLCGQDAQGIDLLIMRPNSFRDNPCYYSGSGTYQNLPTRIVETDSVLCVQWAANSHDTDAGRNLDGGVRISLSSNTAQPSQAQFDEMILANNIPFEQFAGTKVKIPALPVGDYTLQYYWSWPQANTVPLKMRLFVSCTQLKIVAKGDPSVAAANSASFPGLGLPSGYSKAATGWFCNAADAVHGNASLPNGAGSAAAVIPTQAAATPTPTPAPTAAPHVIAASGSAPVVAAGTSSEPVVAAGTSSQPAGSVTITDLVDNLSLIIAPCTATDDVTTINGDAYKEKCISVVNNVYATLKFLTIRIRTASNPLVYGMGGITVESATSRTYNVDLFGGVPRYTQLTKTSSFYYPAGSSSSVEFVAHSY